MGNRRANKLERFKAVKATQTRLQELFTHVQKEHVDDEVKVGWFIGYFIEQMNIII